MADSTEAQPTMESTGATPTPVTPASATSPSPSTVLMPISAANQVATPFSTLNQPFAMKLDRNNYSLWKTMVATVIRGHRLDGYINGLKPCPPEFLTSGITENPNAPITLNPDYET